MIYLVLILILYGTVRYERREKGPKKEKGKKEKRKKGRKGEKGRKEGRKEERKE